MVGSSNLGSWNSHWYLVVLVFDLAIWYAYALCDLEMLGGSDRVSELRQAGIPWPWLSSAILWDRITNPTKIAARRHEDSMFWVLGRSSPLQVGIVREYVSILHACSLNGMSLRTRILLSVLAEQLHMLRHDSFMMLKKFHRHFQKYGYDRNQFLSNSWQHLLTNHRLTMHAVPSC